MGCDEQIDMVNINNRIEISYLPRAMLDTVLSSIAVYTYQSPQVAEPWLLPVCQVQEIAVRNSIIIGLADRIASLVLPNVIAPGGTLIIILSRAIRSKGK
jgi:hypothetical protein